MKRTHMNRPWEAYVFLSPWLIGLFCFTIIPMIMSLYFSFTQYDMASAPKWIGLTNYIDMAHDPRLLKSLQVTFTYVGCSIPLQLAFALLLATVLKKNRRGVRFCVASPEELAAMVRLGRLRTHQSEDAFDSAMQGVIERLEPTPSAGIPS